VTFIKYLELPKLRGFCVRDGTAVTLHFYDTDLGDWLPPLVIDLDS
jgi:hypothetical protein